MQIKYIDGQPCEHKGCDRHLSHPCEGCGRIGAKGVIYEQQEPLFDFALECEKMKPNKTMEVGYGQCRI